MIILVLILCFFAALQMRRNRVCSAADVLQRDVTIPINGFFVMLVFIDHFVQCVCKCGYSMEGLGDCAYSIFRHNLNQLHVVSFLFFSGYGMMEAIKKRGMDYIRVIPKSRFLSVYTNFVIGVSVFIVLNFIFGHRLSFPTMLAAITGWVQIGNPSWFIVCILWCYASVFIVFEVMHHIDKKNDLLAIAFVCALVCLYIMMLILFRQERTWWYNTALVFPFGMIFSKIRDDLLAMFKKYYMVSLFVSAILCTFLCRYSYSKYGVGHNLLSCAFMLLVVIASIKLRFTANGLFGWLGRHVFSIYMYQFVFFFLMTHSGIAINTKLMVGFAFSLTLLLTMITAYFSKAWTVIF